MKHFLTDLTLGFLVLGGGGVVLLRLASLSFAALGCA